MRGNARRFAHSGLTTALLVLGLVMPALSQAPGGRRDRPGQVPPSAGPGQIPPEGPGQTSPPPAAPGGPGQGPGVAQPELAPPVDTTPLSRYIPGDSVWMYFEFPGLNAFPEAWQETAAHGLLNETTMGEMLRETITQLVNSTGKPMKVNGQEIAAIAEHLMQHGFVVASPGELSRPGGNYTIVVLRNAAHKSVRANFGKLLGQITPEASKPKIVSKTGGRQVVHVDLMPGQTEADKAAEGTPEAGGVAAIGGGAPAIGAGSTPAPATQPGGWAWWVEGNDLVLTLVDANASEEVIAVLDKTRPNATETPQVVELREADGAFTPAAFGFIQLDRPGASPEDRRLVEEQGIHRLDLRWGFEGEALMTVARVAAPSPRKGYMTLFDQPSFSTSDVPPMPATVKNFTMISLEPASVFGQLGSLLDLVQPGLGAQVVEGAKEAFQEKTRLDLENDLLAQLGPKITIYQGGDSVAVAPGAPPSNAALAGVMSALASLKIPEYTVLMDFKDRKLVERALDATILTINDQLEAAFKVADAPAEPANTSGASRPGGSRGAVGGTSAGSGDRAPKVQPPKFQLTSISPKTYTLILPAGTAALTGLNPTVTLGEKHLILSTSPSAARQARSLETTSGGPYWVPEGQAAEAFGKLPANLMLLSYGDIESSFPDQLAVLPSTLQTSLNLILNGPPAPVPQQLAAAGGGPAVGGPGGRRGGGGNDLSVGVGSVASASGGSSGSGDPSQFSGGIPGPEAYQNSGGSSAGSSAGAQPGGPGAGSPGTPRPIQIDPAKIPTADAVRKYLFPSTNAVLVDDDGVRLESREAFPNLAELVGFVAGLRTGSAMGQVPGLSGLPGLATPSGAPTPAPAVPPGGPPAVNPRGGGRSR